MNQAVYIIAEAGVNHNGDPEIARKLIDVAAAAGANAVKFQTFKTSALVTENAPQALYQEKNTRIKESQYDMLLKLELSNQIFSDLKVYAHKSGIDFLSTAFDYESLSFLVEELGVSRLKVASGELTNLPFLLSHARTGCEIIISTGMASLGEIEAALAVLAFGYLNDDKEPSSEAFEHAYCSSEGQEILQRKVTLLHCTSDYPASYCDVHLSVLHTLSVAFDLPVGYSDHTSGIAIPIAAVAKGAKIIEKHFTLDKSLPGPDHLASLCPKELKSMVQSIRQVECAIGNGIKKPSSSELNTRKVARKSLVAAQSIMAGEKFNSENIAARRPGNGTSASEYWKFINKVAERDYKPGELILE